MWGRLKEVCVGAAEGGVWRAGAWRQAGRQADRYRAWAQAGHRGIVGSWRSDVRPAMDGEACSADGSPTFRSRNLNTLPPHNHECNPPHTHTHTHTQTQLLGPSAEELIHTFCVVPRHNLVYDDVLAAAPSASDMAAMVAAAAEAAEKAAGGDSAAAAAAAAAATEPLRRVVPAEGITVRDCMRAWARPWGQACQPARYTTPTSRTR